MAKPITSRGIFQATARMNLGAEGIVVEERPFWAPCKGVNYTSRLSRIVPEHATELINVEMRDETLLTRAGTLPIGDNSTDIVGVVNFVTVDEVATIIRFRTTAVERWSGTAWDPVAMPVALTGNLDNKFCWTSFGNTLIFSNGVNGMFRYDPGSGVCSLIDGAPSARHLTTFSGRVIASGVTIGGTLLPGRIMWSVKNNSIDWAGIGSGFEDLLSTPGGNVDAQRGVHPITDYTALVLRSNSVWQMTVTGDVEVPFKFSRILPDMGTESPYSFVPIPAAVVGLMKDDVYVVSESSVKSIGATIRRRLLEHSDAFADAVGAYDADEREYVLLIDGVEYRYSFRFEGWTTAALAINPVWIASGGLGRQGLTIDTALGTFDAPLPSDGTIDSEVGDVEHRGMLHASNTTIVETSPGTQTDWNGITAINSQCVLATGLLQVGTPLEETEIVEVQIEYELEDVIQTSAFIHYSTDKGATWTIYSQITFNLTNGPSILACRKSLVGHNIQLRLVVESLTPLRVLAFTPFLVRSKKVNY